MIDSTPWYAVGYINRRSGLFVGAACGQWNQGMDSDQRNRPAEWIRRSQRDGHTCLSDDS
jgi:hypothetical protein